MQEQNSEKVVSLSVRATKMTANLLKSTINEYLKHQKNKQPKVYKGKQSVKHLVQNSKDKLVNIEITDQNIKVFNKTARKYGIDYSLKKDKSADPPMYMIFFKAKDADVMTAAFGDFIKKSMEKEKKPSIKARLKSWSTGCCQGSGAKAREKQGTGSGTVMKFDKKKVTAVLPFVLIGYFFNKVSQAFTSAGGVELGDKIMNGMDGIKDVFLNPLPSLNPIDLLIGVAGGVIIKLVIYVKGKNAKKYRKGCEYGSARCGA